MQLSKLHYLAKTVVKMLLQVGTYEDWVQEVVLVVKLMSA
jgi:hypothetical protein